ncbi:MAG: M28 family peptidase [Acidobacteria bacterium]|nr:M28 family peptidase [Acidobacteriota bacterium]
MITTSRIKSLVTFAVYAALLLTQAGFSQDLTSKFSADKMRERVKKISSDEFEGRGPGSKGAGLATQYIADQLKAAGVTPGNGSSYFQNVPLVGVKADPMSYLRVERSGQPGKLYKFGDDFVAFSGAQSAKSDVNAELVFVGYGIDAPMYNWNDYKGPAEDYKGKVLMMLVNDPPATSSEPNLFGGKALTYYGRWTYKFEEAARRGAAGVILVHTTESAGYGWNVVRTSNGSWRYDIARTPGDKSPFLQFKGWATNEASSAILVQAGLNLDELRAKAARRDFQPVKTGVNVMLDLSSEIKRLNSPNVVGVLKGSDPKMSSEFVVYSAHWDHFGIGEPAANGDKIYNGAYDNASGVAAVLGIADVLAKIALKDRPKRSTLFLFTTGEEQGLLGAEYYSRHPLVPLAKTAADVNLDGVNIFGKVSDFVALGADRSSIIDQILEAANERHLTIGGDKNSDKGFFYRSDHFPFAKVGVPSVNFQHGDTFTPPLKGDAATFFRDYTAKYYHQVTDEYHDWWDASAMVQEAELALAIGVKLANVKEMPRFKSTDEFYSADKKRLGGR